ncbi:MULTISPECIES: tRNA epoxyqueuosine(34) reductase QueG [Prochlorococcus]|uniref:tRNA epoxyqueuosine(34) reductase QueG n=1 Tax=Prochlorococcus TaxID=1218 RepID=UPI000533AA11|nr:MULTISPECIES: tRNA epoxyqueuosine(34) reductase QueG [Prochlorococcus]KGG13763.1 Epoxyqueuosine (oQ) reductase QueG [Prochlorococcus sp. MIT 0601]
MPLSQDQLSLELKKQAKLQGFNPVGIARIPGSNRINLRTASLQRWLKAGNQGDMGWMEAPRRQNIESLLKDVKSVLVVGLNYFIDQTGTAQDKPLVARYAWGNDYHQVLEKRLGKIGRWLESEIKDCKWKICVDSKPLLEKAWAEEAGIGWIGKNSNLINESKGSWIVLGNLLCTVALTPDNPSIPLCGKCDKCIEACPTAAITEPFVINSNKCIAYHNIENRNREIPENIAKAMGKWVAGCDICQDICPWNQKKLESSKDPDVQPRDWILNLTKQQIKEWDEATWKQKLKGSALKRIKPWMWKRNAKLINTKDDFD